MYGGDGSGGDGFLKCYDHQDPFGREHSFDTSSQATGITVTGVSSSYRYGNETRPRNMNVIYIIRVW